MKRTERYFLSSIFPFKKLLPIKLLIVLVIASLSFTSCQEEQESVKPKGVIRLEKIPSQSSSVLSCSISVDSIGVLHNIILERYRQLYNNYLKTNSLTNSTVSETATDELIIVASLQIAIEECPTQDTSALRVHMEELYDMRQTHEARLDYLNNNSSDEFKGAVENLSTLNSVSDIVNLNNTVQSSTKLSLQEKEEFTVISSTYQNSMIYWNGTPNFGGKLVPPLREILLIDALGAHNFFTNYPYMGPLMAAGFGAACSAYAAR